MADENKEDVASSSGNEIEIIATPSARAGYYGPQTYQEYYYQTYLRAFFELNDEEKLEVINKMAESLEMSLPPENKLFQLLSVVVEFDDDVKHGELHGFLKIRDEHGEVTFFEREETNAIPIRNKDRVPLTGPFDRCLSAKKAVYLDVELFVKLNEDEYFELGYQVWSWNKLYKGNFNFCLDHEVEGDGGRVTWYFMALDCAVQGTLEVSFNISGGGTLDVYGTIYAYYDGCFSYSCDDEIQHLYDVLLFNQSKDKATQLTSSEKIQLLSNVVVVPAYAPLVVVADLYTSGNEKKILSGKFTFEATFESGSKEDIGIILGEGSSLDLKIQWLCPPPKVAPPKS